MKYRVSEDQPENSFDGVEIEADSSSEAAEKYVELNHQNLDYAEETEVWVWDERDGLSAKAYTVQAEASFNYYASERKENKDA